MMTIQRRILKILEKDIGPHTPSSRPTVGINKVQCDDNTGPQPNYTREFL